MKARGKTKAKEKKFGIDLGKTGAKFAATRSDHCHYGVVGKHRVDVPPFKTIADVVRVIRDGASECGVASLDDVPCALTFPLPVGADGRIKGRKGWEFFGGKTPAQIENLLRTALGAPSLKVTHDAETQTTYALRTYTVTGVFAAQAFGSSIAFALAAPGHPGLLAGTPSTLSHAVLGDQGPVCNICGGRCVGSWYKALVRSGSPLPAILRAVGVARRLPVSALYVAGGVLEDGMLRSQFKAAVKRLGDKPPAAPVRVVRHPLFSGAIGASLVA
jgi:hypothetical protein